MDSVSYYGQYRVDNLFTTILDSQTSPAGFKRTLPIQIYPDTEYTADNLAAVSKLWESLSGDPGVVALSSDYVKERNAYPTPTAFHGMKTRAFIFSRASTTSIAWYVSVLSPVTWY
jgi:hypothetical protein